MYGTIQREVRERHTATYSPKGWKSLCPVVRRRSSRSGPRESMKGCSKILHEVGGIIKVAQLRVLVIEARYCAIDASLRRPNAVNG